MSLRNLFNELRFELAFLGLLLGGLIYAYLTVGCTERAIVLEAKIPERAVYIQGQVGSATQPAFATSMPAFPKGIVEVKIEAPQTNVTFPTVGYVLIGAIILSSAAAVYFAYHVEPDK